jgi:hypothetical protein
MKSEEHVSNHQGQHRIKRINCIISFSGLCALLLLSGCATQTIFQSSFNSNQIGAPPAVNQAVGTITVGSGPAFEHAGSVLVVAPQPGDTHNWVQLSTANNSEMGANMTCTSLAVALTNSVSFLANLYIPSGNTTPMVFLGQITPNGAVTNQILQINFRQDNQVELSTTSPTITGIVPNVVTNFGTFPRNQTFSIAIVLHITTTKTTGSIRLGGTGASGSVTDTPLRWPIYDASGSILGLNFGMPAAAAGSYEVNDILGEASEP